MKIGIVRETKNEWERRVPLIPADMAALSAKLPAEFYIQPSPNRIFPDELYQKAGATVTEDLSPCSVIMGIKEIKPEDLLPDKVYFFFSHTIKGQAYNMPMLQRILDLKATLVDYERIVDEQERRLIFFSLHAGIAGIIETLWAFGRRLGKQGIENPFQMLEQALKYDDVKHAEAQFQALGQKIKTSGLPKELTPLVVGITGYGNVSKGVQQLLDLLPYKEISPDELLHLRNSSSLSANVVYKVIFKEEHMVQPLSPDVFFGLQDYYDNPKKYEADFIKYLPHMDVLVNATFWDSPYPKHVTKQDIRNLYQKGVENHLKVIGDISCDIEGGIECTLKVTDPGNPVFVYDPENDKTLDGFKGEGPLIMAVDNLPSELPRDASEYFSSVLKTLVPGIVQTDFSKPYEQIELPTELRRALITHQGVLTPEYSYLTRYL